MSAKIVVNISAGKLIFTALDPHSSPQVLQERDQSVKNKRSVIKLSLYLSLSPSNAAAT